MHPILAPYVVFVTRINKIVHLNIIADRVFEEEDGMLPYHCSVIRAVDQ